MRCKLPFLHSQKPHGLLWPITGRQLSCSFRSIDFWFSQHFPCVKSNQARGKTSTKLSTDLDQSKKTIGMRTTQFADPETIKVSPLYIQHRDAFCALQRASILQWGQQHVKLFAVAPGGFLCSAGRRMPTNSLGLQSDSICHFGMDANAAVSFLHLKVLWSLP